MTPSPPVAATPKPRFPTGITAARVVYSMYRRRKKKRDVFALTAAFGSQPIDISLDWAAASLFDDKTPALDINTDWGSIARTGLSRDIARPRVGFVHAFDVVSHIPVCKAQEKHCIRVHGLGASLFFDNDTEFCKGASLCLLLT